MKIFTLWGIFRFLDRQNKETILLISLELMILFGIVDYATGYEISFALFYLIPVSLAAWFIGRKSGLVISIASAVIWYETNALAGEIFSNGIIPIWNSATRLGFFYAVTVLLSRLKQAMDHERELSHTDHLTGAMNSRAFYKLAEYEIKKCERFERPITIVYIDLDNFKEINDQFGHSTGDTVLKNVVQKINGNVRATDILARLGGDEFALLLPETNQEAAHTIVTRLQSILLEEMLRCKWQITFSIGVLTCTTPPAGINEILHQADELMYSAKNNGKNAICFALLAQER
jgi:diguanylate cyclase (GGDEF)-like protein